MASTKAKKIKADSGQGTIQRKGDIWRLVYYVSRYDGQGKPIRVRTPHTLGRIDELTYEQARILADDHLASLTGSVPLDVTSQSSCGGSSFPNTSNT